MGSSVKLSIVIPTISGRSHWLRMALKGFEKTTPVEYETLIIHDKPVCGIAWNEGIEQAKGDYILLAADDLEPVQGWYEAALASLEKGNVPSARILNSDGSLQIMGDWIEEVEEGKVCNLARIPFAGAELMRKAYPILEIHYATDDWFSHRVRQAGWQVAIARGFCFYHHWAEQGRLDERLMPDIKVFEKASGTSHVWSNK